MASPVTDKQEQEICARYVAGENTVQLGAAFGVHRSTVGKILKRNGVKKRSIIESRGGISTEVADEVCRRYQAGEAASTIAAAIGFNKSSVLRCLKRAKVQRRSNSDAHGGISPEAETFVCDRYAQGESAKKISSEVGVAASTVLKILARNGISRRSPKQTSLKLTEAQIQRILSLYAEGMSVTEVAKEVGCGEWSAWHQLRTAGVDIRGARGADTISQALERKHLFASDRPCAFYIYGLARYILTHCKPGIAWDSDVRAGVSGGEYGEEVLRIVFSTRVEAFFLERAVLAATSSWAFCPSDLAGWAGSTEIRAMPSSEMVPIALRLADELEALGLWEFAVRYVPMSRAQRVVCEQRIASRVGTPAALRSRPRRGY